MAGGSKGGRKGAGGSSGSGGGLSKKNPEKTRRLGSWRDFPKGGAMTIAKSARKQAGKGATSRRLWDPNRPRPNQ